MNDFNNLAELEASMRAANDPQLPVGVLILYFGFIIFLIACMWKIYAKAGKPGWAAIVPIYNLVVLLEIIKKPIWWIVLLLIPIVNFIILIIIYIELAKAYGRGVGFGIGLIFLGFIFVPILAFNKDIKYVYGDTDEVGEIGNA
jgi:hypothetical protein